MVTGLPKNIKISAMEVREAISENIASLIEEIRDTLEITPAELTADVLKNGIILTGGGALIRGLDKVIENAIGVPVKIAENPLDCVCLGAAEAMQDEEILMRSPIARSR